MQTYEERIYGRNLQGSQADLMAYYAFIDRTQLDIVKRSTIDLGLFFNAWLPEACHACAQYLIALEAATS